MTDSHDGKSVQKPFSITTGPATIAVTSGSPSGASVRVGAPRSYTVASNITGATYSLVGAPPYVAIDAATGVVTTTAPAGTAAAEAIPR